MNTATPTASLTGAAAAAADFASLPITCTREMAMELGHCCSKTLERAEAAGELRVLRPSKGGSQRVLYLTRDVLAWLGVELPDAPPAPRRRGRPRKAVLA